MLTILLIIFIVGAAATCRTYIQRQSNSFAYESAPICPGDPASTCVALIPATVNDPASSGAGKETRCWLVLDGIGTAGAYDSIPFCSGVWPMVHPGDVVTATIWQGEVAVVTYESVATKTEANPQRQAAMALGVFMAFGAGVVGVASAIILAVYPARRRNGVFFAGWAVPGLLLSALLCAFMGSATSLILSVFAATGVLMILAVKYDRRWERAHGHERAEGR